MQALAQHNDGYHYMLTVINVLSKKAYVQSLTRKTAAEVVQAFWSIFKESQTPAKLQPNAGKEFLNKSFQAMMKKYNIIRFTTASELKASVVERFNRTLKGRMWRYFTVNNTLRYCNVLQGLVNRYNHSFHSSIKMTPVEVTWKYSSSVSKLLWRQTCLQMQIQI